MSYNRVMSNFASYIYLIPHPHKSSILTSPYFEGEKEKKRGRGCQSEPGQPANPIRRYLPFPATLPTKGGIDRKLVIQPSYPAVIAAD